MVRNRLLVGVAMVALVVSALLVAGCGGPEVPDVVGMRQDEAVRALQDAGYTLGDVSFVATTGVELGLVAGTQPAAGEKLKEGSPVAVAVAHANGKRVLVPTVVGLSQVTAQNVAEVLGMTPVFVEQYSDKAPKGEVAEQIPSPGSEVDAGSSLVMIVSKGTEPEKKSVPDVVGKSESDATSAIDKAGLDTKVSKVYSDTVAKGKVIVQLPEAGTKVSPGSDVQIAVSLGKGTGAVKVPNVTGKSQSDASKALTDAGFKVKVVSQPNGSVAKGRVAAQFPASGATAAKGSEVLISVSSGAPASTSVSVPDLMGMTESEATDALSQAGLSPDVEIVPADGGADVVVYQFPAAGTSVESGSAVLAVITTKK